MKIDFRDNPELMEQVTLDVMPCFAIYSAANAVTRFYRRILAETGLTYPQYLVMMVLWETGGTTMRAISERLLLDSSTLTPLIKKLETQGLVARSRNREDERLLDVVPTDAGLALRVTGCEAAMAMNAASGEALEELQELRGRLDKVRIGLNEATARVD
ncbi:MarR family transcriptional regulator [Mesorhizobium sp. CAU 1741]|uniref:MarR family winged helix-turn-helix transcriptional regulator n=1 Tax=Mesorhizobium sp. CAU 1741 TaxID=3140366 RepID=UPI00325AED37